MYAIVIDLWILMIFSYMEKAHDSSSFSKTCDQNLWIRRQSS